MDLRGGHEIREWHRVLCVAEDMDVKKNYTFTHLMNFKLAVYCDDPAESTMSCPHASLAPSSSLDHLRPSWTAAGLHGIDLDENVR
jgi:hypothetical protein